MLQIPQQWVEFANDASVHVLYCMFRWCLLPSNDNWGWLGSLFLLRRGIYFDETLPLYLALKDFRQLLHSDPQICFLNGIEEAYASSIPFVTLALVYSKVCVVIILFEFSKFWYMEDTFKQVYNFWWVNS